MIYSAYIYLTKEIPNGLGGLSVPVLRTENTYDKNSLLSYLKKLEENKIIQGYRVVYNLGHNRWYNDSEVKYLAEGKTVIGIE